MQLDGSYPNGHRLSLRVGPEGASRQLSFKSDDFGASMRLLGIADNVSGGRVTVNGQVSEVAGHRVIRGHAQASDFHVANAPVVAQLLSLPSFSGFAGMASGQGVPFTVLSADFTYAGERVELPRLVAYGEPLGVTASGWFDTDRDQQQLQGTVAPLYALNSFLGNLPLIGGLFSGGEGKGLIAANYQLSGSSARPQVAINPLSVLTPGFLQHLFDPNFGLPTPQTEQAARP